MKNNILSVGQRFLRDSCIFFTLLCGVFFVETAHAGKICLEIPFKGETAGSYPIENIKIHAVEPSTHTTIYQVTERNDANGKVEVDDFRTAILQANTLYDIYAKPEGHFRVKLAGQQNFVDSNTCLQMPETVWGDPFNKGKVDLVGLSDIIKFFRGEKENTYLRQRFPSGLNRLKYLVFMIRQYVNNKEDVSVTDIPPPPPPNVAPSVNAGQDQTITFPAVATLAGTATDDGLPIPPGSLITTWAKVSGPGTVTFADANAVSTTATFSAGGVYELSLVANDGAATVSDNVQITVSVPNVAPFINSFTNNAVDADLGKTGIQVMEGNAVTFNATASDADNGPTTPFNYAWWYRKGNDPAVQQASGQGPNINPVGYVFAQSDVGSTYRFTLNVSDGADTVFRSIDIEIISAGPVPGPGPGPGPGPSSYLFDDYPGAIAGFALRRLSSTYSGPAIQVEKSGGATQDIGFLSNGNLDIASLESFCTGTCTVKQWYDQSPNASHFTQSDFSKQPVIVRSGRHIKDWNGLPAVEYDYNKGLSAFGMATPINNHDVTIFLAHKMAEDANRNNYLFGMGEAKRVGQNLQLSFSERGVRFIAGDGDDNNGQSHLTYEEGMFPMWPTISMFDLQGSTMSIYRNRERVNQGTNSEAAAIEGRMHLGFESGGYKGLVSEVLLYPHQSDANLVAIYNNINTVLKRGPDHINAGALLPQEWQYQVDLYDWLETLTESDFRTSPANLRWDGTYANNDALADLWLNLRGSSQVEYGWDNTFIRVDPRWFTINTGGVGIEATGQVRNFRFPAIGAFWYSTSIPLAGNGQGNPYYQDRAVCMRALSSAVVDQIMDDDLQDDSNYWSQVDFSGGSMLGRIWAYRVCKHHLDANVQKAFEDGFAFLAWKHREIGPHGINSNMDTKMVAAHAHFYVTTSNPVYKQWALEGIKHTLFGSLNGSPSTTDITKGIYRKAGYIQEGSSPETTYNGVSLFYLTEAWHVTKDEPAWDFMDEVISSMADFKVHQHFRDSDDYWDGPGGYAGRTGGSYVRDQRSLAWRDNTVAANFIEGRPLFRSVNYGTPQNPISTADMVTDLNIAISDYNSKGIGSSDSSTPSAWSHSHWPTDNHYRNPPGWYSTMVSQWNDVSMQYPYERSAPINKSFDDEFWAYKANDGTKDFGFFVESLSWPGNYDGWYGGSLQEFWTRDGTFIRMKHDKTGNEANKNENTRVWSEIDKWAAHHIWGRAPGGNAFTNATTRGNQTSRFNLNASPHNVYHSVDIGSNGGEQTGNELSGTLRVENLFEAQSDGLKITHTLTGNPADQITELWATLPVLLRDESAQLTLPKTTIEYWNGSTWIPMSASLVNADTIRLGRDFGAGRKFVWIKLDQTYPVKLSASEEQLSYQTDNRLRNVHVDLHGNPGNAIAMPSSLSVEITLTTTDPGLLASGPTPNMQYPEPSETLPAGGVWAAQTNIAWNAGGPGTVYFEYSTDNQSSWNTVGTMTDTGGGVYEYLGGTIPVGVTHIRTRAVDGNSVETSAVRTVTSSAQTRVFADSFSGADGTILSDSYSGWDVNTTGNNYFQQHNVLQILSQTARGTIPHSWGNNVTIDTGTPNVILKGTVTHWDNNAEGGAALLTRSRRYYEFLMLQHLRTGYQIFSRDGNGNDKQTNISFANVMNTQYTMVFQVAGRVAVASIYDGNTLIAQDAIFGVTVVNGPNTHGFRVDRTPQSLDDFEIWTW